MLQALKTSSPGVLITRMLIAAIVVFGTYNPSGTSVFHWIKAQDDYTNAWIILAALVALMLNFALLIAAWKALGRLGTCIVVIGAAPPVRWSPMKPPMCRIKWCRTNMPVPTGTQLTGW